MGGCHYCLSSQIGFVSPPLQQLELSQSIFTLEEQNRMGLSVPNNILDSVHCKLTTSVV
jgi:hypothetical protein